MGETNQYIGNLINATTKIRMRSSGSLVFGTSTRNGLWETRPESFEGQVGLTNGEGSGLAETADDKEVVVRGQITKRYVSCG